MIAKSAELAPVCHVTSVLLVTWRISNDELALRSAEVAIANVDGDALFAFSFQAVGDQCRSNLPPVVPTFLLSDSS